METAFLAFGSNLGDRRETLCRARAQLRQESAIEIVKGSRLYETEPVGGPAGQPAFLNAVIELRTDLAPQQLLSRCLAIEGFFGRQRKVRWGARTLDLDILFYGADVVSGPHLTIPHPLLHERPFVLLPLADIAPGWIHPVQKKTIGQLCADLEDISGVRCLTEEW